MEFRDLKTQFRLLKPQIMKALEEECEHCKFISGPSVQKLEEELAAYVGTKYCISCANGTDALLLALKAWNIGPGDAVFVPDFTFFASGEVVSIQGATPIFVDVDQATFNMSPQKLEESIHYVVKEGKLRPSVIIPVDLFGLPADYEAIRKIASKYNLRILEDGAQGFGGMIKGQRACSFGDISTTSFFPAKPLGCYGDGGAIFTDSKDEADLIRSYAIHGRGAEKYDNVRLGCNSRLDSIQATILSIKLKAFQEHELNDVNEVAKKYDELLGDKFRIPYVPKDMYSSWAQYTLVLDSKEQREYVKNELRKQGIPTMIYYPKPMHNQKAFENTICSRENNPVTERLCNTVLSLPMHPYLQPEDIERVATVLHKAIEV